MSRWSNGWRKRAAFHGLHVGFVLAAFLWFALIAFGSVLVTTPETGRHSHLVGWTALVIAFVVLVKTMDRWIHYARTFLGFGIVGGWVILWRGHLLGSQTPVPRIFSALVILMFAGCSFVLEDLAKRPLQVIDRVGLVAFAAVLAWAMAAGATLTSPEVKTTPWGPATAAIPRLIVGFGIVLALWTYHRYAGEKAGPRRAPRHEGNEG